ncbi:MAG: aminopeptidase [Deinococcota bacterium]|jgi:aminopeptidase|nr:aminopeptidase [Deinococcota bacterium]
MIHPLHEKYAKLLTQACLRVEPGDNVSINLETTAEVMARPVAREVLRAGGIPHLRMHYPAWTQDLLELAPEDYFEAEPTVELREVQQMQAWLRIGGAANSRALQGADKSRLSRLAKRNRPVQNHRVNHTKWCGTLFPTQAGAQDAGMSLDDYERFVYDAMFLLDDDPVAKWAELEVYQARVIDRLKEADEVRIVAAGTDLRMSVKGRTWINSAAGHNMPSGEVFTGPVESSASGVITYAVPSAVNGVEVEGIRLSFENGRVVEARADKGDDLLQSQLSTDEGAKYLGELGVGTNYNIQVPTRSILFDEKIGGTVHLALGQSYATTGGTNESAIHWDMICDLRQGGAMYLDGELFQEGGQFKL